MASGIKHTFLGGVHPPEMKELSENLAFEVMPNPKEIIIPLTQHIGKPAKPLVKKRDEIKAGQVIAEADGFISSPIYSPVSGTVTKIARGPHLQGFPRDAILIKPAESDEFETMPPLDFDKIEQKEVIDRVREAGIVGQGGAAFPTFVKMMPPEGKKIDCVILNAAECEPYLTRDYRFMLERTDDVIKGLALIMKGSGVERGYIGIEDNKPKAIEIMEKAVANYPGITVEVMKTKYPQGAEKMLIKGITGREVPPGKLPLDVGVIVQNVGTAIATFDAVTKGIPALTAAMTVTGKGIKEPKNLIVKIGTPLQEVIDYCGGLTDDAVKVIAGGPMMGMAQYDFSAPVMKATSGLLVLTKDEVKENEETACLRCGMCVDACPVFLMPTKLALYGKLERWEDAEDNGVLVCMECGSCAYTCPANIPLVQWIKLGKQEVMKLMRERQSA